MSCGWHGAVGAVSPEPADSGKAGRPPPTRHPVDIVARPLRAALQAAAWPIRCASPWNVRARPDFAFEGGPIVVPNPAIEERAPG